MPASDVFEKARRALAAGRLLDAKLLLVGAITELAMRVGIRPVLTGGTSVDFYAAEALETDPGTWRAWRPSIDVDVVFLQGDAVGDAGTLRRMLAESGFEPSAGAKTAMPVEGQRGWRHPKVPIPIEIIGHAMAGDRSRVVQLDVEGLPVFVRGPEDTLFEHVEWAAHTKDQRSWTRALAIAAAQEKRLDKAYLRELAKSRGYLPELEQCLRGEALT